MVDHDANLSASRLQLSNSYGKCQSSRLHLSHSYSSADSISLFLWKMLLADSIPVIPMEMLLADSISLIPMENGSSAYSISVIPMENSRLQFGDSDGKCQSSVFQTQTWAEGIKRRETGLSVDIHQNHHHPSGKSEDKTSTV